MHIHIESVHVTIDRPLKKKLHNELSHLAMLFDHIVSCDVALCYSQQLGAQPCEVTLLLSVPDDIFVAREQAESFEKAIAQAVDELVVQLKRDKDRKWHLLWREVSMRQ